MYVYHLVYLTSNSIIVVPHSLDDTMSIAVQSRLPMFKEWQYYKKDRTDDRENRFIFPEIYLINVLPAVSHYLSTQQDTRRNEEERPATSPKLLLHLRGCRPQIRFQTLTNGKRPGIMCRGFSSKRTDRHRSGCRAGVQCAAPATPHMSAASAAARRASLGRRVAYPDGRVAAQCPLMRAK